METTGHDYHVRETRAGKNSLPPSKRPRLDDAAKGDSSTIKDDEEQMLSLLVEGDEFVTDEQREQAEAERRRLLRQKRLTDLQQQRENEEDQKLLALKTDHEAVGPVAMADARSTSQRQLLSRAIDAQQDDQGPTPSVKGDANDDDFDMFSSSVSPPSAKNGLPTSLKPSVGISARRGLEQGDWDDPEGYYKAVIGEEINLHDSIRPAASDDPGSTSFRVLGVIGKGVFSSVVKCSTISNTTSIELPPIVAIKLIRSNETMAKAALTELQTLHRLVGSHGIVPLLMPTTVSPMSYKGHVAMVFRYMEYNLRDVVQKFGKGVGLSLLAVRSYFGQLLAAGTHLQKHGIIHADLKPDNILVSEDFGEVQLADFGSAIDINSPDQNQPTPYLVSRFYRAPEIILGLEPTYAIDLWSLAVSVAELFLGNVLFVGKSNNDMLYSFMQHLGAFSPRMIRQHLVQCKRLPIPRHFQQEGVMYTFRQQAVDPVSGVPVHKILSLLQASNQNTFPLATPLHQKLLKAKSAKDTRRMVSQFSDLLQKCLALDPTRRIALKDALRHEFFQTPAKGVRET